MYVETGSSAPAFADMYLQEHNKAILFFAGGGVWGEGGGKDSSTDFNHINYVDRFTKKSQ